MESGLVATANGSIVGQAVHLIVVGRGHAGVKSSPRDDLLPPVD